MAERDPEDTRTPPFRGYPTRKVTLDEYVRYHEDIFDSSNDIKVVRSLDDVELALYDTDEAPLRRNRRHNKGFYF
ncbi:unnamed protein product [Euphydryas editha]|uniref:Uncharacterized protein n=1 Tax=Euphydryas editha TaxID=104508 RepID=A0AAU9UZ03_EUPED|nr:unnamed protein product [Euphydryas editha]